METNSSCVSSLKDQSAIDALIPGGCCIILDMILFPVSINYYSSYYPSFILLGKESPSLEDFFVLLTFPLCIFLDFDRNSQSHVNENLLQRRQWNNTEKKY